MDQCDVMRHRELQIFVRAERRITSEQFFRESSILRVIRSQA